MTVAMLAPGETLVPGYRVTERLARGEALDVYSVWSAERDCLCAAKTLRPDRYGDRAARRRLLAEGRLLHRLDHPHLVRGYATFDRPRPAVVMEVLGGETLGHLMDRRRRGLVAADLARLGLQLCSAVGYLHRSGVLHLDLKPSNVVADAGQVRLLDLSHARPPGPCPPGFGTRAYMAPEQVDGGAVDAASDVFGLAGVLYRAATRRRPFGERRCSTNRTERPPFAALRRRRLPRPFGRLVEAGFEPRPQDRPTLPEVAAVLRELAQARPGPDRPAD